MMEFAESVMSRIPSTFNSHQISTTIIGGQIVNKESPLNISVVLLNNGNHILREEIFENLLACNFASIVSVEKNNQGYGIEDLTKKYPQIKFILPQEQATDGEIINIAMGEVSSDYVLVLRDSLYIPHGIILTHLAERLTKNEIYCVVPRLLDSNKNSIPCSYTPSAERSNFKINSSAVATDGMKTLYPYDYIALYNRKKFIQLGGFDYTIKSPYWQNLDLAMRSWLWGEETKLTTLLQFTYTENISLENKTRNMDYLHCYLKNELPKLKNETGIIRKSSFIPFLFHSSCGFIEAKRLFNDACEWVSENKYKFKMDLQTLITTWRN